MDELGGSNPEGAEDFVAKEVEDLQPLELDLSRLSSEQKAIIEQVEEKSVKTTRQLIEICSYFGVNPENFSLENDARMLSQIREVWEWAEAQKQFHDPGTVGFLVWDFETSLPELSRDRSSDEVDDAIVCGGINKEYPLHSGGTFLKGNDSVTDSRDHLARVSHLAGRWTPNQDPNGRYEMVKPFITPGEYEGYLRFMTTQDEVRGQEVNAVKLLKHSGEIEDDYQFYPGIYKNFANLDQACRTRTRLLTSMLIDRANRYGFLIEGSKSDKTTFRDVSLQGVENAYADSAILIHPEYKLTESEAKEAKEMNLPFSKVEKEKQEASQQG